MPLRYAAWSRIGASPTVVNWIQEGVPIHFKSSQPPAPRVFHNHSSARANRVFVTNEIRRLLSKGFIEQVHPEDIVCCLPLQVAPKKSKSTDTRVTWA